MIDNETRGNKGEWSEPYVALRVVSDGKLRQADDNLKDSGHFALITGAKREDTEIKALKRSVEFVFEENGRIVKKRIRRCELLSKITSLRDSIRNGKGHAFRINANVAIFLGKCGFRTHKNPVPDAQRSVKRDISLSVEDTRIGPPSLLGFSIKSYIGSSPSLVNHSGATSLRFRLFGFSDADMDAVNRINGGRKLVQRCDEILRRASTVRFAGYANSTFEDNLKLIDGDLPEILASAVYAYYFGHCGSVAEAIEYVSKLPEYVDLSPGYCAVKFKRFLRACGLGMMPSEPWNDQEEASGGYVIVQPEGDLLAFYVYNRAWFDRYLFENTHFDRPSDYKNGKLLHMIVVKESGNFYIDCRLQIRFK